MKIRFCLYEFVASSEEIHFKKTLFAACYDLFCRRESHGTASNLFSDIFIHTQRKGSCISEKKWSNNSTITTKDWICISETVIWEDLGEKLFIIASFHRRQFKLYSLICAQLLRQLSIIGGSNNTHISCNAIDPSQADTIIDIDLPRFYPLMNRYHSYTPINREFFSNFHACLFGNERKSFLREKELNYLSSKRVVIDLEKRIPCEAYQKAIMQVKTVLMPNVDPIYEDLMQYLYRAAARNHDKAITSGGSNLSPIFHKSVLECIADLESPVQMFGDTSQGAFRKHLSCILTMIENEDDHYKGCASKARKYLPTPIPHSDFYYLSQISHFIEEPERLLNLTIPKKAMSTYYEAGYACSKLVANMENTDRFCNYWIASELRRCIKVIENMLKALSPETLSTKQIEAIKRLLSRIVDGRDQVIGGGDVVMINVFPESNSWIRRLKFWKR
nr:unnamed protein product [Naegleria fowleri]